MTSKKIAYQGTQGAYAHLVCVNLDPHADIIPCNDFSHTLIAVEKKEADLAVIPIENAIGGRVAEIHQLLANTKLYITGEYFLPIHHNLVALPDAKLADIKTVTSHPQALLQCKTFLSTLNVETIPFVNTAKAAVEIAARKDKSCAAIASSLAADVNQLKILKSEIADITNNVTRFIIMERQPTKFCAQEKDYITAFIFGLQSVPAALYKALGGFATHNVNLLKLESYVDAESFQDARFYVEIEGHKESTSISAAIKELAFFSCDMKIFGSFPQSAWRKRSSS